MGERAYFHSANNVTVNEIRRYLWFEEVINYVGTSEPTTTAEKEEEFAKSINQKMRDYDSDHWELNKSSTHDFLWLNTQIITAELVAAVRAVCKIIGYGDPDLGDFFQRNIGKVVWSTIE